jgi:nitrate/TMAO reductase-like tetraheme cytochrome c subunit
MEALISNPLAGLAVASALIATVVIVWFLIRRPPLVATTKVLLLLGIGVFPIATAGTGNLIGYEATKTRHFCGSCHVMQPWVQDSLDPGSATLASQHARNPNFGADNCYACHADYGMYGTIVTKLAGLRHVYEYHKGFDAMTLEQAMPLIHLRGTFRNQNCMQCHSTRLPGWLDVPDHAGLEDEARADRVSCVSPGCHGPAHPFSKEAGR